MRETRRIKLRVAYDGTAYQGFQRQPDRPTIQAELEAVLSRLAGHAVTVHAAGRTDAGVHAAGQTIHFDLTGSIPTDRIVTAANGLLPPDIVVYDAQEVAGDFHARYDAIAKTYRYSILEAPFPWPFIARYVYFHPQPLDLERMKDCFLYLRGKRDFAAFQSSGRPASSTVRTLQKIEIDVQQMSWGRLINIAFTGDGFLYRMVRNIVGTLLEVATGRRPPSWVAEVLESRDRRRAGKTAPAAGLNLIDVKYNKA